MCSHRAPLHQWRSSACSTHDSLHQNRCRGHSARRRECQAVRLPYLPARGKRGVLNLATAAAQRQTHRQCPRAPRTSGAHRCCVTAVLIPERRETVATSPLRHRHVALTPHRLSLPCLYHLASCSRQLHCSGLLRSRLRRHCQSPSLSSLCFLHATSPHSSFFWC